MDRREFATRTGAAAAGLMIPKLASAMDVSKGNGRPNVLFIMTDQQSARMMSCTGNKWLNTPAVDRLARSGIRFERAYACNPVCVPNRFSLQTGLMPSAIGMRPQTVVKVVIRMGRNLCRPASRRALVRSMPSRR